MTKKPSISDQLRSELAGIEGHQTELIAERDEISYLALVDRDKKAIERLAAINTELANITSRASSLAAALREASSREIKAHEQEMAQKRRDDARQADVLLAEAEDIARKIDDGLTAVRENSIVFEKKMIEVRRLTGDITPRYDNIRVFLVRALRSAVHRGPLHIDPVPPSDITTVSQAMASWSKSIRGVIAGELDKTTAKKAA